MNPVSQRQASQAPHYHPSEDLIFRYGAGMLDEAVSLVVASHLAICADCRHVMTAAEMVGGQLLDELPPLELAETSWQKMLSRLGQAPAAPDSVVKPTLHQPHDEWRALLPSPLRPYIKDDLEKLPWRRLGSTIRELEIIRGRVGTARLLYVKPGGSILEHTHRGDEFTLTLMGSYVSKGREYKRGDFEHADPDVQHEPTASQDSDCLCLVVTDARLRFTTILGRLLQPWIRI